MSLGELCGFGTYVGMHTKATCAQGRESGNRRNERFVFLNFDEDEFKSIR